MAYAIAHPEGCKRPALYRTKQSGGKLLGIIPDDTMYGGTPIALKSKEIIVHLGDEPPVGSVYGVYVEPICERFSVKNYGELFNYIHQMHDSVRSRIVKAFPEARKRMMKLGPALDWEYTTEVRNPRGKIDGLYKYRPKGSDVLVLHPAPGQSVRELAKVIAHKFAHGVWFRYMDASQRSKWIKLYERYVKVTEVSVRDIRVMIKDMRQIASVYDYLKDAEPEEQKATIIYLTWLKKVHTISKREAQDLISSGDDLPIPDTHLHRSATNTPITLYSKESAPELFAEAIASHVVGDLGDARMKSMIKDLKG